MTVISLLSQNLNDLNPYAVNFTNAKLLGQAYSGLAQEELPFVHYLNPGNGTNIREFGISYSSKSELKLFDDLSFSANENGLPISFYLNFPLFENLIVQFNYSKKFSLTAEIDLRNFDLPDIGFTNLEPYFKVEVNEFTLPIAYQITDKLSAGLSVIYDQITYEFYVDPFLNNFIEGRNGDASAFIFKAGLLYQATENLNLAFVFQPEKSILIKNELKVNNDSEVSDFAFDYDYLEFLSYAFAVNIHTSDNSIHLNADLYYRDVQNNSLKDHVIDYNLAISYRLNKDFTLRAGNFYLSDASEFESIDDSERISQNYLTVGITKSFHRFEVDLAFATSKWGEQNESSHTRINAGLSFQF